MRRWTPLSVSVSSFVESDCQHARKARQDHETTTPVGRFRANGQTSKPVNDFQGPVGGAGYRRECGRSRCEATLRLRGSLTRPGKVA